MKILEDIKPLIEQITNSKDPDEVIFYTVSFLTNENNSKELSNEDYIVIVKKIIEVNPDAQLAAEISRILAERGQLEIAKKLIEDRSKYTGDQWSMDQFDEIKGNVMHLINNSNDNVDVKNINPKKFYNKIQEEGAGDPVNEKETERTSNKIKQLLSLPDYNKIDAAIELAVSLEEPKIFDDLIEGCSFNPGESRPKLNEWMQRTIITNGSLVSHATGYYIFLSLWLNIKEDSNIHESLKKDSLKELSLVNCYLDRLPSAFINLSKLVTLDLSKNNFSVFPNEKLLPQSLKYLIINKNPIENISSITNNIKNLKSLKILLAGNFNEDEECKNNLNWKRTPIPEDFSKDIEIIDLGLDYESCGFSHTAICGAQCGYEFHKSNLIVRNDRLNCESCDDPDEFTFICKICKKFIAPFVWYTVPDKFENQFNVADFGDGFDEDDFDPEYNKLIIPSSDGLYIGSVCSDCAENIDPISERNTKSLLPGYGDDAEKLVFYLKDSIDIEKQSISDYNNTYNLKDVAEWNYLEYENSDGNIFYAEIDNSGTGAVLIQKIIDDDGDLKKIFIQLMQDAHREGTWENNWFII
jgi:hypothetical protein